jgi:hypothetical protein
MKLFTFLGAFAATAAASFLEQSGGVKGGTILRPHTPPGHDLTDVFHLIPKSIHELHYRGAGATGGFNLGYFSSTKSVD